MATTASGSPHVDSTHTDSFGAYGGSRQSDLEMIRMRSQARESFRRLDRRPFRPASGPEELCLRPASPDGGGSDTGRSGPFPGAPIVPLSSDSLSLVATLFCTVPYSYCVTSGGGDWVGSGCAARSMDIARDGARAPWSAGAAASQWDFCLVANSRARGAAPERRRGSPARRRGTRHEGRVSDPGRARSKDGETGRSLAEAVPDRQPRRPDETAPLF
jgi:hypothetical protein